MNDKAAATTQAISLERIDLMNRYWSAANYISVGQIYLLDNPLLREPLKAEHVKPRLLGHWGTTPGLNFLYLHLNRIIRERDLDVLFICGPGHGGPAMVANTWLEGTYGEIRLTNWDAEDLASMVQKGTKVNFKDEMADSGDTRPQ
jgi:xylulose-5-phosphate/fructose-6-phosphate phosphoketolase